MVAARLWLYATHDLGLPLRDKEVLQVRKVRERGQGDALSRRGEVDQDGHEAEREEGASLLH